MKKKDGSNVKANYHDHIFNILMDLFASDILRNHAINIVAMNRKKIRDERVLPFIFAQAIMYYSDIPRDSIRADINDLHGEIQEICEKIEALGEKLTPHIQRTHDQATHVRMQVLKEQQQKREEAQMADFFKHHTPKNEA